MNLKLLLMLMFFVCFVFVLYFARFCFCFKKSCRQNIEIVLLPLLADGEVEVCKSTEQCKNKPSVWTFGDMNEA